PRRAGELRAFAESLARWPGAVVAFESPRRLPGSLRALADLSPGRMAAVCRELTKRYEEVVRGSLEELAARFAEPPRGEVTLVVAAAEGLSELPVDDQALSAVSELVEAGAARRTAAEVVAKLTGTSRNALYRDSL
ncbi:MAG TPA: SAM-dependent methyltransferase, partial [Gaiellaceae bacterium]|nr:SAM-dependent methyltransferase [Gaiellaceae bacterium]